MYIMHNTMYIMYNILYIMYGGALLCTKMYPLQNQVKKNHNIEQFTRTDNLLTLLLP